MNIIISGYGKMGKEIEAMCIQRGHKIQHIVDELNDWEYIKALPKENLVVIDFSQPDVVKANILRCFHHNIPIVVGTTGWNKELEGIKDTCKKGGHTLFVASNFSIGVNLFFALNQFLSGVMNDHLEYDVSISETHHIHKLDKPSGTAITLVDQIIRNLDNKKDWLLESDGADSQVRIDAIRKGEVFGDHTISYESPVDKIKISHSAKNRKGFATGAVLAAEWVHGKTGYFEMKDYLGFATL